MPQIASVERVSGRVEIVGASGPVDAELGKPVQAGDGIRSASDGTAVLRFPDGTRVSLGMDTSLARLTETNGKTLALERGIVAIDVVRQPAGRPLAVSTSHAEATALGTAFTVYTTAAFTRLDVTEGRVKFSRPSGVSSVVVPAGHYAIAGAGYDLTVRAAPGLWKAPAQGLLLWLRADAGVKVSEGGVAGWADQSTSGNSASQGAAGRQPTLVAGALGGRPAIRFDGADDFLSLPTGFGDFRAGLSVFFVARIAPGTGWVRLIDLGAGPQADNIFFGRKQTSDNLAFWVYANDQTRGKVDGPGGITSDQAQTLSAVLAPQGKVTLYRNGAAVGTGTTSVPSTGIRKPNYLGKSNYGGTDPYLKADVAEILLFNRALADAERGYVEAYLQAKYFDATFPPAVSRPAEK